MAKRSSNVQAFSVREFFARFPTEDVCLEHIMAVRFGGTTMDCPSCGCNGVTFHKLRERRVYACPECRFQIAPTANTILHDTRTPLVSWFYAMYLFCTTRHGVSGKELQRQLGVTYKTAYRMGMQIRTLTAKADHFDAMLSGHVELDEAYVGGRVSGGKRGRGAPGKTIVMGLVERGGRTVAAVIPDVKKATLRDVVLENVEPGSLISTDELMSYGLLVRRSGRISTTATRRSITRIPWKASGGCSKRRYGQRTSRSAPSICNAIWTSSLFARTIASG